jgi:hypothetical protein
MAKPALLGYDPSQTRPEDADRLIVNAYQKEAHNLQEQQRDPITNAFSDVAKGAGDLLKDVTHSLTEGAGNILGGLTMPLVIGGGVVVLVLLSQRR